MLTYADGQPFSTGACHCLIGPLTEREKFNRIMLRVSVEGMEAKAFVDTGGAYLICSPEVGQWLRAQSSESAFLKADPVLIRGLRLSGELLRESFTLLADEGWGEDLTIQATAFLPDYSNIESSLPSILGLTGCLERTCFALDPKRNLFHFGEI